MNQLSFTTNYEDDDDDHLLTSESARKAATDAHVPISMLQLFNISVLLSHLSFSF
jgi:hypothetical protein